MPRKGIIHVMSRLLGVRHHRKRQKSSRTPAGADQALAQVVEIILGNIHFEGLYVHPGLAPLTHLVSVGDRIAKTRQVGCTQQEPYMLEYSLVC